MGESGNPQKAAEQKAAKAPKPVTFDRLRSKKAIQKTIYVHLDPEISDTFDSVDERLESLRTDHRERRLRASSTPAGLTDGLDRMLDDEMSVLEREWEEANAALQETTVCVRMKSPGRKKYEELLNEHPPTDEQNERNQKDHGADAPYNAETFGPALIAMCAVEPKLTVEQAQELVDDWNLNEAMMLFVGALEVCQQTQVSHLGKGSGRTSVSTMS